MKKKYIINDEIENELSEIENRIIRGEINNIKKFPSPKKIIIKIEENNKDDSILVILKRLYIDYCWVSSFTHGSPMSGYTRSLLTENFKDLRLLLEREKVIKGQFIEPSLNLDYLSILIVLTDIFCLTKNNYDFINSLIEFWNEFSEFSLLAKFFWERWAKRTLNILDLRT